MPFESFSAIEALAQAWIGAAAAAVMTTLQPGCRSHWQLAPIA
eukprot:CAMPEP_0180518974 /NCGR_PEP_ID=MMETSP1036_2-20121128/55412_1 /TAXON_ID=632150 /ORGANISM="Azadinium spinosum, Strain 3D9" /LENGTH=42 /DNA_ID= /DNA_START= /DNA_END= /DNA_ORIENTATION=